MRERRVDEQRSNKRSAKEILEAYPVLPYLSRKDFMTDIVILQGGCELILRGELFTHTALLATFRDANYTVKYRCSLPQ